MTPEQLFAIWAPPTPAPAPAPAPGGPWSPWAKPVLFAHLSAWLPATPEPPAPAAAPPVDPAPVLDVSAAAARAAARDTAVVVDLPGIRAVAAGLALAQVGYRPVPLFNAAPGPVHHSATGTRVAVVDVWPILHALQRFAPALAALELPPDAPPAFLLDANRRTGGELAVPGRFDNRSVSFPADFPSATFLQAHGIRTAILVQAAAAPPQPDLAHTLRRWQDAGITLLSLAADAPAAPTPLHVARPSWFGWLWYQLRTVAGLRRSPFGGFGGMVPQPSSG